MSKAVGEGDKPEDEGRFALDLLETGRASVTFSGPPLQLPDTLPKSVRVERSAVERAPLSLDLEEVDLADSGALRLVGRISEYDGLPDSSEIDLREEMRKRMSLDDFTGALRTAELLLGQDDSFEEARAVAEACRTRLIQMYTSRLGGLTRVPTVTMSQSELHWLGLDHRAGFLLSRVDGQTVEDLMDVSGMPALEALRTLCELVDVGAIRLR